MLPKGSSFRGRLSHGVADVEGEAETSSGAVYAMEVLVGADMVGVVSITNIWGDSAF